MQASMGVAGWVLVGVQLGHGRRACAGEGHE